MSNYLYKNYFGKYRILVPIDQDTNDFPRDDKGKLEESEDFYIPCRYGEITHYGHGILEAFVTSLNKGRKLVQQCKDNGIETMNVKEGDGELYFRFRAKDIDFIAKNMGAKTMGKNIRPFSIRNLPKSDYTLPREKLAEYQKITDRIPIGDKLAISKITNDFISEKLAKKYKDIDINKDIKKKCMSRQLKEYIHSIGEWENYLKYLRKNIEIKLKEESLDNNTTGKDRNKEDNQNGRTADSDQVFIRQDRENQSGQDQF